MNRSPFAVIIAVVVMIAVLTLGWIGLIAPQLTAAANAGIQIAGAQAESAAQSQVLAKLKADNANLSTLKKQLADLHTQIPADAQLDLFISQLNAIAQANGITLVGITNAVALPYASAAAATAPTTPTAPTSTAAPAATPAPAATAPATTPAAPTVATNNLYTLAVTISVGGTQDQILAFSKALQTGKRLFIITTMSFSGTGNVDPATGTLTGYIFIAPTPAGFVGDSTATPTPTPTPAPTDTPTPSATSTATPTPTPTP
jgi:Tfp pilus assembly protein PilO